MAYSPRQNGVAKRRNRTLLKWLRVCFLTRKCFTSYRENQLILWCIFSTDVQQKQWKIKHRLRLSVVESQESGTSKCLTTFGTGKLKKMSRVISLNLDFSERYKEYEIIQVNTKREIQLKGALLSNIYRVWRIK